MVTLITFGLACVLSCAICFGMSIAIIAGIAYGYNYSMAEFISFTRSDVTVYMRRGQFYDRPDLAYKFRRTGDEDDLFTSNATTDYEDHRPPAESKPLADTWLKTQDTRKYAEVLTKYSPDKRIEVGPPPLHMQLPEPEPVPRKMAVPQPIQYRTPQESIISIVPNPLIPTVSWRSGSTEIKMRNFRPMQDFTSINRDTVVPENLFPTADNGPKSISILSPKEMAKGDPAEAKRRNDFHKSYVPMRVWGTTARPVIPEEVTDEVDEDNIVYKPV